MVEERIFDPDKLIRLLKKAEKQPINFALGIDDNPAKNLLVLHIDKTPKKLWEALRNGKGFKGGAWGQATTNGKLLTLQIEDMKKAPSLGKKVKLFLKSKKEWRWKKAAVIFQGQDITDVEEGDAAVSQEGAAPPMDTAALAKAADAWDRTRELLANDLQALQKEIAKQMKGAGFDQQELTKSFKQLSGVVSRLDGGLSDKLRESARATSPESARRGVEDATKLIAAHETFVRSDPLLKNIDRNPFVSLKTQKTLATSLKALKETVASHSRAS